MDLSVAILIDGSFFLKRYRVVFSEWRNHSPSQIVENLYGIALKHLGEKDVTNNYLYRIFYYDCFPFNKKVHNPITNKVIDFEKTEQAIFRLKIFQELKRRRKVALRLGYIKDTSKWLIKPDITKKLLQKKIKVEDLHDADVFYEMKQKGVDIKIGLDIASLAYKKLVNRIILISGDGDFVPAAKLARREGIDFILDPMWNHINPELFEHIDGLKSTCQKPKIFQKDQLNVIQH